MQLLRFFISIYSCLNVLEDVKWLWSLNRNMYGIVLFWVVHMESCGKKKTSETERTERVLYR